MARRETNRRTGFHGTIVLRIGPATLSMIITSNHILTNDTHSIRQLAYLDHIYWPYSNDLSEKLDLIIGKPRSYNRTQALQTR